MTKMKKILSSIKGKILNNKVMKAILIFIIGIFFVFSTCTFAQLKNNPNDSIVQTKQEYVMNTINNYIQELQEQGYENVTYQVNKIVEISEANHIPYHMKGDLETSIIRRYDYFAHYYFVKIKDTEYVFQTKASADYFISELKKYDKMDYTLQEKKDFVFKETKQEVIDNVLKEKRIAYEKTVAAAQAKAKVKAQKAETSTKDRKSSTSAHVSQNTASLQSYAHNLVINTYGWSEYDYECLVKLWNRESHWNPNAHNKKSGAHGIPQSLPASKMASEGSDYYTNGYTQIRWGLKYIKGRYGLPSAAWAYSQRKGWY